MVSTATGDTTGVFAQVSSATGIALKVNNTASGATALLSNTTGKGNTASGVGALEFNSTGNNNTASGVSALTSNTTGVDNTGIGESAGLSNTTGDHNTFLGFIANASSGGALTNATAIGANAVVSASNALVLGSINGKNGATSNVNVGIGTTSPIAPLHVVSAAGGGVIFSQAQGTGGIAIVAEADAPATLAGDFVGDVEIFGNLSVSGSVSKGSGAFKIDDPIDPARKFLSHSFVESPDMMDIYNGNVVLDADGQAWVEMPKWFQALNKDFRYQLTAIGGPGPNLYIAQKVRQNRFKIAGGSPGLEVSWQVTGVRHDPYANAHRIKVEEPKPSEEVGYYLHPEVYGQPREKSVQSAQGQGRRSQPEEAAMRALAAPGRR